MDKAVNDRLRAIDNRLKKIYEEAHKTAVKNHQKAMKKLSEFNAADHSDMTPTELRTAQLLYKTQVERTTGITEGLARDIANSGKIAAKMISGERLNIYEAGYKGALSSISKQLGFDVNWSIYDKNQLKAILDSGVQPFSKIGAREVYDRSQRKYIRERALGKLGDDRAIVARLQNELAQAVINGEGVQKIATRIKSVAEMSRRQAVTVARTESMRVANQGHMMGLEQARDEYGIEMVKQWISTLDSRTRDSHNSLHLETAELDEPFSNGLMHPHADGPPEEIINCRCTVVSVLKGVDGGQAYKDLNERVGEKGVANTPDGSIIKVSVPISSKNKEEERLKSLLGTDMVKTKGLSAEVLNSICNELETIYSEYPQLRGVIQQFKVSSAKNTAAAEFSVLCEKGIVKTSMTLNTNYVGDTASITKLIEDNVSSGHWTPKNGIGGIVRHEMAHALEFQQTFAEYGVDFASTHVKGMMDRVLTVKAYGRHEVADKIVSQALDNIGARSSKWDNLNSLEQSMALSKYAQYSVQEAFAEAMSDFSQKELSKEIVKLAKGGFK